MTISKNIEKLLLLFIFLLPLQTRYIILQSVLHDQVWEYLSISIYFTECILWIILLYAFFIIPKAQLSEVWLRKINLKGAVVISMLLLVALSLFSSIWAINAWVSLHWSFRLLEGAALFIVFKTFSISFQKISYALIASGTMQAAIGTCQVLFQRVRENKWLGISAQGPYIPGASVVETSSEHILRAYGFFPHPNILAGFLLVGIFLSFYLYIFSKNRKDRAFFIITFIAQLFGLLMTFSRAGWLTVGLGFLFLVLVYWKKRSVRPEIIFISLVALAVCIIFSFIMCEAVSSRISGSQRLERKSNIERIQQAFEAIDVISKNTVLGVGAGNYTLYTNKEKIPVNKQPVHITYLLAFAELGFVGIASYILLIFSSLMITLREKTYIGSVMILSICVVGFLDHYYWSLYAGMMIFWVVLAASLTKQKF